MPSRTLSINKCFVKLLILISLIIGQCLKIPRQFESNDYYKVLGLNKNFAPAKEIKKAYHKLALQYHPDKVKNQNDAKEKQLAEAVFVKISEAYDVLGDDKLKSIYDRYGKNGLDSYKRGVDPEAAGFGRRSRQRSNGGGSASNGRSSYHRSKPNGAGGSSFKFKFNDDFDPFETPGGRRQNHKTSDFSHFHFSSGGKTWTMNDFQSSSNSPFALLLLVLAFLFMIITSLFIIGLVLAITFFPITLYLIWRCVRKQKNY